MKSSIHQILIELRGDESEALRTVGRVHQPCRKETELVPGGTVPGEVDIREGGQEFKCARQR